MSIISAPFFKDRKFWISIVLVAVGAVATFTYVKSQVSPPNIPPIVLSADPLYAATVGDKPAMALALSVEYPTVGAQYLAQPYATVDDTYSNTNEYLGYYDAESCYNYNDAPTETPAAGFSNKDYKRFDKTSVAPINRMCDNAFSGNFLNWASSSAIDMMRMALSGGDRYIDTTKLTVLQRAVLPNGNSASVGNTICMWNSPNFPAKKLQKDGSGNGKYWGAVPSSMMAQANGNDIWVANTLNQIYFGTSNTGYCGYTDSYTLGTAPAVRSIGPITNAASALPSDAVLCSGEYGDCNFTGVHEVWYGTATTTTTGNGSKAVTTTVYYWAVAPVSNGVSCSNTVFGDPIIGLSKSCFYRTNNYTGTWTPSAATGGLNTDGFFYSRVQVCNTTSAGILVDNRDYNLCTRYPNGTFKPTGSIQKYSEQLRISSFGYVLDQTASYNSGRYGAVLRAPMKFVGAKTYDINGNDNTPATGNPNMEWDITTGIFATNPDGDITQAKPISGVINYLNKFGRTGAIPGQYKYFDPVGELHYETLRYLQGLQPSPDSITGLTDPKSAFFDGFPITKVWTDPYGGGRLSTADYSCLKSNIVVIGDNNTHDGNRLPVANIANNIPDIDYWRSVVQDFERGNVRNYTDGQGTTRQTSNPNTTNSNVATNTTGSQILGSAYWSHTHDIRGSDWISSPQLQRKGLRVKTFVFDVNEYANPTAPDYRQKQDQLFTAAKYGGFESDASNPGGNPYNTVGNPFQRQNGTNDNNVWQNASTPGDASTYYLQGKPRSVLSAFDSIFSRSASVARSIAGTAAVGKDITAGGTLLYQSSFDTSDWSGDVLAFPVSLAAGNSIAVNSSPAWSAATRLGTLTTPATSRNIIVGRSGALLTPAATPFQWAVIDQALKDKLNKPTQLSVADNLGQDRLNYLAGDRTKEGVFRKRNSLLGDIINSGVVYQGEPIAPAGATSDFIAFKTANAARSPAVFVGANDGMMHSFNAVTGDELFAYIPSSLGDKLSLLTSTTYNNNHQSYVDASPIVAEAKIGTGDTATDWKSVLISGTGGGAPGVFALDVTTPANFSSANVLWEFTKVDDVDMGFVVGRPRVIKLRTSKPGTTPATFRYFAAVASGVNNYVSVNGLFSIQGKPALFLLALDKPQGAAWTTNSNTANYYKILLPVDATLSITNPTGLINLRPIVSAIGETQQIYMGDLHGKLWKIDFTKISLSGPSDWNMEKLTSYNKGTAALPVPYPLFTAQTITGNVQPITMAPLVAAGPVVSGIDTAIIGFGTGKYLETIDKVSTTQNTFYAVYDNGLTGADSSPAGASVINGRGRLQAGAVNPSTLAVVVPAFKFGRPTTDTSTLVPPTKSGFYFDLPENGERTINNGDINGDFFLVSSLIPASAGAAGSCTAAGGGGNAYSINIDSGNSSYQKSTVGLLGDSVVFVVSDTSTASLSTGKARRTVITKTLTTGSTGSGLSTGIDISDRQTSDQKRMSWRQISNYRDLFNAPATP